MQVFGREIKDDSVMKSLTGLSLKEFDRLVPSFSQSLKGYKHHNNGQKGMVCSVEQKLFLILLYVRSYPTYRVMEFVIGLDFTRCNRWVMKLKDRLSKALGRELVMPERKIRSVEEFLRKFPQIKDIFVDGTERRVNKPKKIKTRNKLYSGKKKTHTVKNVVISDERKRILFVSRTRSGRRHDKRVFDKDCPGQHIPETVTAWADSAFIGLRKMHQNTQIPKKATKNNPLSFQDKLNNKVISGIRIVAEHSIMGIKRCRAASDIFRNKILTLRDDFFLLAAGIWNFHLQTN
jgi:hypothetical protein